MNWLQQERLGLALCAAIAIPCYILGQFFPLIGGPVIAILTGMGINQLSFNRQVVNPGITYTSKKILQYAVILLGFGLNLQVVLKTGLESLPIILCTITVALLIAYICYRTMSISSSMATLIGVGSSICGGSAIAATAPIIKADDKDIAQAISVIFFFNLLAALLFPALGTLLGISQLSGEAFGLFAGTAVNDTSSVTATASTWDSMYGLGSETLDKAVTVKLTRTLAIIPITLFLAFLTNKQNKDNNLAHLNSNTNITAPTIPSIKKVFPHFILYFIGASLITTIASMIGISNEIFTPMKSLSKFFIVMAMVAIGLNTDIVKLIRSGSRPLLIGLLCWTGITISTLLLQYSLGLW